MFSRIRAHAAMLSAWAVILAVSGLYAVVGCWLAAVVGLAWWWGLLPVAVMLVFGEAVLLLSRGHPLGGHRNVEITRELGPRVHEVLDRLCALSGRPRPELRLLDLDSANALTHVRRDGRATIYLSADLVIELDTPELEAVLAHEMAHIAHRDERMLNFAIGMTRWPFLLPMSAIAFLYWFDGWIVGVGRRRGLDIESYFADEEEVPTPEKPVRSLADLPRKLLSRLLLHVLEFTRVVLICVLGMLCVPLLVGGGVLVLFGVPGVFLLNQQRELAADRAAARLTGAPSTLAAALDRLQSHHDRIPTKDLRDLRDQARGLARQ